MPKAVLLLYRVEEGQWRKGEEKPSYSTVLLPYLFLGIINKSIKNTEPPPLLFPFRISWKRKAKVNMGTDQRRPKKSGDWTEGGRLFSRSISFQSSLAIFHARFFMDPASCSSCILIKWVVGRMNGWVGILQYLLAKWLDTHTHKIGEK